MTTTTHCTLPSSLLVAVQQQHAEHGGQTGDHAQPKERQQAEPKAPHVVVQPLRRGCGSGGG